MTQEEIQIKHNEMIAELIKLGYAIERKEKYETIIKVI
jgi:hypothetical protein